MNQSKKSPSRPTHSDSGAKKSQVVTVVVLSVAAVIIAACIVALIIINLPPKSSPTDAATQDTAVTTTVGTSSAPAASGQTAPSFREDESTAETTATAPTDQGEPEAPQELAEAAETAGVTVSEIPGQQLALVRSSDTSAVITFFEKRDNTWELLEDMTVYSGFVGRNGVSKAVSEHAEYTPFGVYALGTGFGINENPGTAMPYFQVTPESYWVDDPASVFYNRHVEGTENADWDSAEHLIDYQPSYNYAVEIRYNTDPVVPGKGSAFFMHVGSAPTAGCVAMPEENMLRFLQWLDPEKKPHVILI